VAPRALALLEPVAVPVLDAVGDGLAFAGARAVFEDYTSSYDRGEPEVVAKMVDYWFGSGAFTRLPPATRDFLVANTGQNVHDVRATFREQYAVESLRRLAMPVLLVHGTRSPEVMARICRAIASHVGQGSLVPLEGATHAMTAIHADRVADLIGELAERVAPPRA
jgi:pimeloyl-ACP methyl ester carboxylesterase